MHLTLLAAAAIVQAAAQPSPPQFHVLPPSSLADFTKSPEIDESVLARAGIGCLPMGGADDIVVCARRSNRHDVIDPRLARRYARRPRGPDAGIHHPSSAMEASRCAVVRCVPQGLIGIGGSRF